MKSFLKWIKNCFISRGFAHIWSHLVSILKSSQEMKRRVISLRDEEHEVQLWRLQIDPCPSDQVTSRLLRSLLQRARASCQAAMSPSLFPLLRLHPFFLESQQRWTRFHPSKNPLKNFILSERPEKNRWFIRIISFNLQIKIL